MSVIKCNTTNPPRIPARIINKITEEVYEKIKESNIDSAEELKEFYHSRINRNDNHHSFSEFIKTVTNLTGKEGRIIGTLTSCNIIYHQFLTYKSGNSCFLDYSPEEVEDIKIFSKENEIKFFEYDKITRELSIPSNEIKTECYIEIIFKASYDKEKCNKLLSSAENTELLAEDILILILEFEKSKEDRRIQTEMKKLLKETKEFLSKTKAEMILNEFQEKIENLYESWS